MKMIQTEVHRGMQEGAVGISTGLDYIVQCYTTTDELVEACKVIAEYDGVYTTHVRYKKGILDGIREAVEIGKRSGCRVHISHVKGRDEQTVEALLSLGGAGANAGGAGDAGYAPYAYAAVGVHVTGARLVRAQLLGPRAVRGDGPRVGRLQLRLRVRGGLRGRRLLGGARRMPR